jgi:flagellar biosynthesis/type III secretory pathway protein FliH
MSFHLAYADSHSLLTSDRAVVKRSDRIPFCDALALLQETSIIRSQTLAVADKAREEARREGLNEARLAAHETVANGLADIATAIEAHAESRRADIAEAAFAAARAIIGEMDNTDVMERIVDRAIARLGKDAPLTIEIAPALRKAIDQHIAGLKHVTIVEQPGFEPTDCRILTDTGQIVASLSVQFDALATRWGLENAR